MCYIRCIKALPTLYDIMFLWCFFIMSSLDSARNRQGIFRFFKFVDALTSLSSEA